MEEAAIINKRFKKSVPVEISGTNLIINGETKTITTKYDYTKAIEELIQPKTAQVIDTELFNFFLRNDLTKENALTTFNLNQEKGSIISYFLYGKEPFEISKTRIVQATETTYNSLNKEKTQFNITGIKAHPYAVFLPNIKDIKQPWKNQYQGTYMYAISAIIEGKEKVSFEDINDNNHLKNISERGASITSGFIQSIPSAQSILVKLPKPTDIQEVIEAQKELYAYFRQHEKTLSTIAEINISMSDNGESRYNLLLSEIASQNRDIKEMNELYGLNITPLENNITTEFAKHFQPEVDAINRRIDLIRKDFPQSFVEIIKKYGVNEPSKK